MRWIGSFFDAFGLAICLAMSTTCAVAAEADSPATINPLRVGGTPRSKAIGRWVEWRAGAKWEGEYQDGKRHGDWTGIVPITEDSDFASSEYEGFESPLTVTVTLQENVAHGEISAVDAAQRPVFTWQCDQGVLEGKATWWHASGQERREVTYRAGLLDGPVTQWDAAGKVTRQETYREGRRSEAHLGWHQPGRKHFEGYSELAGEVTRDSFDWLELRWTQDKVHEHASDERCGRWTAWYPNGQKKVQGNYQEGKEEGRFTWWYDSGQKKGEGEYLSGKRHGLWRTWHANGRKHREGEYEYGQMSGDWKTWTDDGRPAASDRSNLTLILDWDEAIAAPKTAKRASPPTRPSRPDATSKVIAAPSPAAAQAPKRTTGTTASTITPHKGYKPTSPSATARSGKSTKPQSTNAGVFPGLLPAPSAAVSDPQPGQQFTLLDVLLPSEPQTSRAATKPQAKPSPVKRPPPSPTRRPPQSSTAPPQDTRRDLLAELLGIENPPPLFAREANTPLEALAV